MSNNNLLRVLVAVKRVIDYNVRVNVRTSDKLWVETNNVKHSMNPFDEIAIEEAVRMREAGLVSEVIAVSIGSPKSIDTLRTALAMGADKAIYVTCDGIKSDSESHKIQPLSVAKILYALIKKNIKPDLIFLGKQAIDDDSAQTGSMLAALLGWSQSCYVSKIKIDSKDSKYLIVTRETDFGTDNIRLKLPSIITTDLRLNTPRFASLPNIMKAKKKIIETINSETLGITKLELKEKLNILNVEEPPKRLGGGKVNSIDELILKLKNEAKII